MGFFLSKFGDHGPCSKEVRTFVSKTHDVNLITHFYLPDLAFIGLIEMEISTLTSILTGISPIKLNGSL